jgi:hypothetical protein
MIVNKDEAKLETIIKFSRCCLVNSDSKVKTVIPIIPFIGVLFISTQQAQVNTTYLISCDILARNSDLLLFAISACCLATVFFSMLSLRL